MAAPPKLTDEQLRRLIPGDAPVTTADVSAALAYAVADAMLKERAK